MIGIGPAGPTGGSLGHDEPTRQDRPPAETGANLEADGHRRRSAPGAGGTAAGRASRLPDDERRAWAALSTVTGLGPVGLARLVAAFGTAAGVLEAALAGARVGDVAAGARGARGLDQAIAAAARGADDLAAAITSHGVVVIPLVDDDYPRRLRSIDLPPPVLFVQGSLEALSATHAFALVGTRRPTDAGRRTTARLAAELARRGAAVVSGLAVGIDGVAHAAAVAERGRTVAVLGGGHARLYPRSHRRLAEEIVAVGGAVVSELPPATPPARGTFPRRNRVISGLSDAAVVVEAGEGSGALITAGWALEQGRDCFAVPGPLDEPSWRGCLSLLREYAGQVRVVAGIAELMEDLGLGPARSGWPAETSHRDGTRDQLGALEASLATTLVERAQTVDELAAHSRMPVAAVLGAITLLEARGLVVGVFGRYQATPRLLAGSFSAHPRQASTPG